MKKFNPLMVPRSVQSKKRENHTRHGDKTDRPCCEVEKADTKCSSTTCETVRDVLAEMVNESCIQEETAPRGTVSHHVSTTLSDVIKLQADAPYVDVGPLSYNNKVPVFHRTRKPVQQGVKRCRNFYTGLTWEPRSLVHPRRNREDVMDDYFPRQWEYTGVGNYYLRRPARHRGFEFTVMSYNILAQNLLDCNYQMYSSSPSFVLEWKYRKKQLMKELRYHSPDVICLQEVYTDHYEDFFQPELQKLGYGGAYMQRTGDKLDGCATFYKKRKFECVEVVKVPYCHRHGGSVLDRDNVGLIVKLKPLTKSVSSQKTLVVANTHLLFNPRRGDVKLAQLMVLLAELDKCAYTGSNSNMYQAVIMCGDFNSEPHSDIYKLVVMGYLEYEGLLIREISGQEEGRNRNGTATLRKDFLPRRVGISDYCQYCDISSRRSQADGDDDIQIIDPQGCGVLKHQLKMVSVYQHRLSRLKYRHREITTHHGKAACTVDYMFYGIRRGQVRFYNGEVETKGVQEGHLSLLARYGLLSDRELREMGSLPNDVYGSDHLGLVARFLMT